MALDDAERASLEEIERQLTLDTPRLARTLGRAPRVERFTVPTVPVAAATLVLLAAFGWMSVLAGSTVPLLLALPPVAAAVFLLVWQHTAEPAPQRDRGRDQSEHARHDGPPTWWFT